MGVSLRSIVIGFTLIPLNCLWVVLSELIWYSGQPTSLSLLYNVVFILFWLVLANLVLLRYRPKWALSAGEMLVIYTMLSISSAICSHDMIQILVPTMAHLARYQPIEGKYGEILAHVPRWLMVEDATALESAYIGQESMYKMANLGPWLMPFAWWGAFIMALIAVMWGLNLVVRKQWTENEKLAYPIIQVPMLLTTETKHLLTNRLFWLAFAIAGLIDLVNGINYLFPLMPKIPIVHVMDIRTFFPERPWSDMGSAFVSFYPFAIGMAFFMPLDLAFSCWFFFVFWKLQRVMASHIGVHGMPGFPYIEEQTAGGYYAIALIALWITRHHLKRFGALLLGKHVENATPWERRESRIACILIVAGFSFLFYFSLRSGMDAGVVVVFFVLYFLISLAVTRMRAELGPPSHDLHHVAPYNQIMRFVGTPAMLESNPKNLAMFGFFNFFNRAYRGNPMPHGLEGFRIAERMGLSNARYFAAMCVAVVGGIICGFWAMLYVLNRYGAAAQALGPAELFGREAWESVNLWFTAPEPHLYGPTYAVVIGLFFSLGLAALRMNLAWWPFHPVGYAISGSWSMDQLWLAVFVAWAIKSLLLKYGGVKMYRPAVPFFVGLILGDFIVGGLWNLYGIIMEVEVYHFWPY